MSEEVATRAPRSWQRAPLGIVVALVMAAIWAFFYLDLRLGELVPRAGGLELAVDFFGRAFTPAWRAEAEFVPAGTPPLLALAVAALFETIVFAAAAMGLSIVVGLVLGVLGSTAFWQVGDASSSRLVRTIRTLVFVAIRLVIAGMRSVHELLWAVLFLVAVGLSEFAAVVAIAIPYSGTLAKVYGELLDETPAAVGAGLRGAGASSLQAFAIGVFPRAAPDMLAYTFYRFECALRSSAVLGFFGYPTIGLYVRQSFLSSNYGEVWTFLYSLIALVLVFDAWSGSVRARLLGVSRPAVASGEDR